MSSQAKESNETETHRTGSSTTADLPVSDTKVSKEDQFFRLITSRPVVFVPHVIKAAVGVATNPWRETRLNFGHRYNRSMADSTCFNWSKEISDCPDCHHSLHANLRMYRKGDTLGRMQPHIAVEDSHCTKHWNVVARHNKYERRSQ